MPSDASIKKCINKYQENLKASKNISQFDYCYCYFYTFYKKRKIREIANRKNLQMSCLQLGFYLASFGMMRRSAVLSKKSLEYLMPLIELISNSDPKLWEIDIDSYLEENNIDVLLKFKKSIKKEKILEKATDTLVTKIMLGVYGNIPAFDRYFRIGFGVHTVNENSLRKIGQFYNDHRKPIDSFDIKTRDFLTGKFTKIICTKARLIDMYGFQKGKG